MDVRAKSESILFALEICHIPLKLFIISIIVYASSRMCNVCEVYMYVKLQSHHG